jgi:hypothetical protein
MRAVLTMDSSTVSANSAWSEISLRATDGTRNERRSLDGRSARVHDDAPPGTVLSTTVSVYGVPAVGMPEQDCQKTCPARSVNADAEEGVVGDFAGADDVVS